MNNLFHSLFNKSKILSNLFAGYIRELIKELIEIHTSVRHERQFLGKRLYAGGYQFPKITSGHRKIYFIVNIHKYV